MKECITCKSKYPISCFYEVRPKKGIPYRVNQCRECIKAVRDARDKKVTASNKCIPETKKCSRCRETKQAQFFSKNKHSIHGLTAKCKECLSECFHERKGVILKRQREYYEKNKEIISEKSKVYRAKNTEKTKEYHKNRHKETYPARKALLKEYAEKNKEKIRAYQSQWRKDNKETLRQKSKEWFIKNKENVNQKRLQKRREDPLFKMSTNLRARIRNAFNRSQWKKNAGSEALLGAPKILVMSHIQSLFKDGMTWDNHGTHGWHIDHIIPLNSAKTQEELVALCHYTNLQPLWASDNISKGAKIF